MRFALAFRTGPDFFIQHRRLDVQSGIWRSLVFAFEIDPGQVLRPFRFEIDKELETAEYENSRDNIFSMRSPRHDR